MSVRKELVNQQAEVIVEIKCDNCPEVILPVYSEACIRAQGKDMLHVTLSGGYGELMDGEGHVHLCKDCAQKLCEVFPLFAKVVDYSFIESWDWNDPRRDEA